MGYQVLARKWRPQQFKDMIGQDHVVKALTNALDNNRLHHAYLFTGMRGVGKTTIARVFAKSLNCETKGVSSEPCGQCSTCQDIEAGRFFDLIEVDAASRTKVEDTRELLENVPYAPASGRYKVYLIDEVHMFSNHSFNALLKTLEEPPEHVKFILATTDPQKVPVTILSRCLQFNLKSMADSVLSEYLGKLLDAESIAWEPAALMHIARASEGSVRDALSLVEQSAAFGEGSVRAFEVESMLGRMSPERLLDLLESVASLDAKKVIQQVDSLAEYSPDYGQLLAEILSVLHQIALVQSVDGAASSMGATAARIESLAQQMASADVQLFYQIGLHGRRDMPYAPDQRAALEMTLLRMVEFKPATSTSGATSEASQPKPDDVSKRPEQKSPPSPTPKKSSPLVMPDSPDTAEPTISADAPAAPVTKTKAAPVTGVKLDVEWTPENWRSIIEKLGLSGMPKQLANNCVLGSVTDTTMELLLDAEHDHLNSPRFVERLQESVSTARGKKTDLTIQLSNSTQATPANLQARQEQHELDAAHSAIQQDPLVKTLLEKVGGVVDESSIKPVKPD